MTHLFERNSLTRRGGGAGLAGWLAGLGPAGRPGSGGGHGPVATSRPGWWDHADQEPG